jgi:hypothetical protein
MDNLVENIVLRAVTRGHLVTASVTSYEPLRALRDSTKRLMLHWFSLVTWLRDFVTSSRNHSLPPLEGGVCYEPCLKGRNARPRVARMRAGYGADQSAPAARPRVGAHQGKRYRQPTSNATSGPRWAMTTPWNLRRAPAAI